MLEHSLIHGMVNAGRLNQDSPLTLMDDLLKRNRTRTILGRGRNVRFFVLDFDFKKFYYKRSRSSQDVRLVCAFS